MCGIAGQWTRSDLANGDGPLSAALRALRHRGPDDCGQELFHLNGAGARLFLGHTRLSIIDLSAGGHQPMRREGDRYSIVYNGEIYNYRELRAELERAGQRFTSESDTEVLLAAWATWQESTLARLTGMFAFAIYDKDDQTITLARDAFGIKPLAYYAEGEHFAFASEVAALRHLLPGRPRLNRQRAYDYLVFGSYDDSDATFFEGIKHLLPGHVLRFDLKTGTHATRRWWWPGIAESEIPFAQAAEAVREMFLENVRLHLRSDVPVGAALSGGIDSSAIVCAMRRVEPKMPIHTFSYVARGSSVDEEPWADLVNAHVRAVVHKVTASAQDLVADLDDMIRAQGEPFGSTSIYAQYRVFRLARERGITVTLEGQGADELFAGYDGYPGPVLRGLLRRGQIVDAVRFARAWSDWPGRSVGRAGMLLAREVTPDFLRTLGFAMVGRSVAPSWLSAAVLRDSGVQIGPATRSQRPEANARFLSTALRGSLVHRGLPGLLRHGDRNSMRWSIESRVPFLTTGLAEYVLRLPDRHLISAQGESKHLLRAALRGIVPDAILARRDKIGFATPEREWLVQIAGAVRGWLADADAVDFLYGNALRAEFDAVVSGRRRFSWQVWRWVNFVRWHTLFFGET